MGYWCVYIGESKVRNEILAYFKGNVDSTEENGGYKIHERRVCIYLNTEVLTKTKRTGSAAV